MTLGEKIRFLRKKRKLTQKKLAEEIGVSLNIVYFWETERIDPTLFNAIVLADYFGVTLDELCCREVRANGQND
jgi:transcriptional regulator with XRE-family HTH domain